MCKIETQTDEYPHTRTTRATTTTRRCTLSKDSQPCRGTRVVNLGRTVHRSSSEVSSGPGKYTIGSGMMPTSKGAQREHVQVRSPKSQSQRSMFGFRMPFSRRRKAGEEYHREHKRPLRGDHTPGSRREDVRYEYRVPRAQQHQSGHTVQSVSPRGYVSRVPEKRDNTSRSRMTMGSGSGSASGARTHRSPREPTGGPKRVRFRSQLVIPSPIEIHQHKPLSARPHQAESGTHERRDRYKSLARENVQIHTARPRLYREDITPISRPESGRRMSYVRSRPTGTPASVPRQADGSRPRPRIIQDGYRQMEASGARVLDQGRDRPFFHGRDRPEYARMYGSGSGRERDGFGGSERRYGWRWR